VSRPEVEYLVDHLLHLQQIWSKISLLGCALLQHFRQNPIEPLLSPTVSYSRQYDIKEAILPSLPWAERRTVPEILMNITSAEGRSLI
jgi:hypothetical protein